MLMPKRETCVYGILQDQATVDHSSPQLQVHQVAQHKLCASFWGRGPKGAGTGMAVRACKASFLAQRILRPRDALPVRGGAFNPIALGKPVNEPVRARAPPPVPHSATSRAADRRCAGRRAAARAGRAAVGRRHRQPKVLPGPVPARQQGHPLARRVQPCPRPCTGASNAAWPGRAVGGAGLLDGRPGLLRAAGLRCQPEQPSRKVTLCAHARAQGGFLPRHLRSGQRFTEGVCCAGTKGAAARDVGDLQDRAHQDIGGCGAVGAR